MHDSIRRSSIAFALGSVAACARAPAPAPAIASAAPTGPHSETREGFRLDVPEFPSGLSRAHFEQQVAASARSGSHWRFAFRGQGWGCTCPDWVIRVADDDVQTVYPVLGPAARATSDFYGGLFYAGTYRVVGRFAAERITGAVWTQRTGQRDSSRAEDASGWESPEPVIIVDDWCFEPFESPPANMRDYIDEATRAGIVCPGSPTPTYDDHEGA